MPAASDERLSEAKDFIRDQVFMRVEPLVAVRISKQELTDFVNKLVAEIANERKILLNQDEQHALGANIVDEMVGLGPIEPLLRDPTVSDILVNGAANDLCRAARQAGAVETSVPQRRAGAARRSAHRVVDRAARRRSRARCSTPASPTAAAST